MKSILVLILILASMVLFTGSVLAKGGSMDSGGGNIVTYHNNPWFINRDQVTYCVIKSDNYSLDMKRSLFEIRYAMDDWEMTLAKLKVSTNWKNHQKYRFIKKFKYLESCDGKVDLRIMLGVVDEKVKKVLRASGNGYVAFVKRESFNNQTLQSTGYIWVAPDLGKYSYKGINQRAWYRGESTYYIIMHELGHVLGFQHVPFDPVMGPGMPEQYADLTVSGSSYQSIYTLPDNQQFHYTKHILLKSFTTSTETICTDFPMKERSFDGLARKKNIAVNNFVFDFFGIRRNYKPWELKICLTPNKGSNRELELAIFDKHPVLYKSKSKRIANILLPALPKSVSGAPSMVVKFKAANKNRWIQTFLLHDQRPDFPLNHSIIHNGKNYNYDYWAKNNIAGLSFVYDKKIITIPFYLDGSPGDDNFIGEYKSE